MHDYICPNRTNVLYITMTVIIGKSSLASGGSCCFLREADQMDLLLAEVKAGS
jgi:hypothetical protein